MYNYRFNFTPINFCEKICGNIYIQKQQNESFKFPQLKNCWNKINKYKAEKLQTAVMDDTSINHLLVIINYNYQFIIISYHPSYMCV